MARRDDDFLLSPYVLRGKVTEIDFNRLDYNIITVTDTAGFIHFVYIYFRDMPQTGGRLEGSAVTMWRATNRVWKYVAFDEHIVETVDGRKAALDVMTQKHFDHYKQLADERMTINRRIDVIREKVSMINWINAESNAAVAAAKKTLTDYLTGQIAALRQEKEKYR
ncbi:hypothetical protein HDR63_03475 [bacterium]|nr:hypothetical protein [bacterium]